MEELIQLCRKLQTPFPWEQHAEFSALHAEALKARRDVKNGQRNGAYDPDFHKLFEEDERDLHGRVVAFCDELSRLAFLIEKHAPELMGELPAGAYPPRERAKQVCGLLGNLLAKKAGVPPGTTESKTNAKPKKKYTNKARDKWIYTQLRNPAKQQKEVVAEYKVQAAKKGWTPTKMTVPGLRKAAEKYVEETGEDAIPKRK